MTTVEAVAVAPRAGGGAQRVKVLLGVAAALVVAAQLVPRVVGAGDRAAADPVLDSVPATTTATAATAPAGTASGGSMETTRDPFAGTISAAATTSNVISVGSPAAPAASVAVAPVQAATGTTTAPATPTSAPRFFLVEVLDDATAHVRVNDTVHQVAVNQSFAGSFRVVGLDVPTRCGSFVYGDRRIALCEGEEATL